MLISTIDELRLYSPTIAIDNIDAMQGFLNSSEMDFLLDKLGEELYSLLRNYYSTLQSDSDGIASFIQCVTAGTGMSPYAQLLNLSQRMIAFDALANAIDLQAVSVNGSSVNAVVADDYKIPDREAINAYKSSCTKQAHIALNSLLILLENWAKKSLQEDTNGTVDDATQERNEIVDAWKDNSRYYFLSTKLIIPTALVLQDYLDIYSSREKFITMLPDLHYIQEDIYEPIIGEDFMQYLVGKCLEGTADKYLCRIIHNLRKCIARELESRTMTLKVGNPRRETAHNEAVKLTDALVSYIKNVQDSLPAEAISAIQTGPLKTEDESNDEIEEEIFENNADGSVIFVTPVLN